MKTFTWDYKIPNKFNVEIDDDSQIDWNQTLMTTLNIIARNENILDINIICLVPIKYKRLIDTLSFFNKETMTYKNYKFEFINEDIDMIKINNNIELKILNYIYE